MSELAMNPGHATLWVESTQHKEAARSLEMVHVQLISAVIDPYSWKWAIVAAHHALQAFALAALEAQDHPRSSGPPLAAELEGGWLKFERGPAHRFEEPLEDYLPGLYEKVKRAVRYNPPAEVDAHVASLIQCRNLFIQSMPSRWELYIADLPRILRSCLSVIEHLGWSPGHIAWEKTNLTDLARVKCLASMKILEALERQYRG